jgi:hypothetical protein
MKPLTDIQSRNYSKAILSVVCDKPLEERIEFLEGEGNVMLGESNKKRIARYVEDMHSNGASAQAIKDYLIYEKKAKKKPEDVGLICTQGIN